MSQIILRQVENQMLVASDSHGFSVVIGRSPDFGMDWAGTKASDLLLIAVAACSAYDVIEIFNKQREPLHDLKITVDGDQMQDPPYTFTRIHLTYEFHGAIFGEKAERAIRLSQEKYCSVISTIRPDTPVTFEYKILP